MPDPVPAPSADDLAELRRLDELATPGPWRPHDTWLDHGGHTAVVFRGDQNTPAGAPVRVTWLPTFESGEGWGTERNVWNDADLIVAMRNALPGLLAEVDRLRGANADLRTAVEAMLDRSAAPTREQVALADIARRQLKGDWYYCDEDHAAYPDQWVPVDPDTGNRDHDREPTPVTDTERAVLAHLRSDADAEVVVALLSRSAAEPPEPLADAVTALLGALTDEGVIPWNVAHIDAAIERVRAALVGVAAEPKEHGDGR